MNINPCTSPFTALSSWLFVPIQLPSLITFVPLCIHINSPTLYIYYFYECISILINEKSCYISHSALYYNMLESLVHWFWLKYVFLSYIFTFIYLYPYLMDIWFVSLCSHNQYCDKHPYMHLLVYMCKSLFF